MRDLRAWKRQALDMLAQHAVILHRKDSDTPALRPLEIGNHKPPAVGRKRQMHRIDAMALALLQNAQSTIACIDAQHADHVTIAMDRVDLAARAVLNQVRRIAHIAEDRHLLKPAVC